MGRRSGLRTQEPYQRVTTSVTVSGAAVESFGAVPVARSGEEGAGQPGGVDAETGERRLGAPASGRHHPLGVEVKEEAGGRGECRIEERGRVRGMCLGHEGYGAAVLSSSGLALATRRGRGDTVVVVPPGGAR